MFGGLCLDSKMNPTGKVYRNDLDLLKGFAILAVVLYHMGISRSGYLGVDAFFVVNGFLIVPKVVNDISNGKFRYFAFLEKRIVRLLPLMLLASVFVLLVGYWSMLPDDYENLGESVIASNLFSNNVLASITTKNYWDVSNDYKALMHTWYIGILFEFYLIFPLIVMLVKWLSKKLRFGFDKYVVITIIALSVISVLLYLNPSVSPGNRFYLLQYRFFELAFGGLAGMWIANQRKGQLYDNAFLSGIGFLILSLIMFVGIFYVGEQKTDYNLVSGAGGTGESYIPQNILLLLTVILTIFFIVFDNMKSRLVSLLVSIKVFCLIGMMSYSIFIWHQPVLAFYRYFVTSNFTPIFIVIFFAVVLAVSYVTYRFVEQKVKVGTRTRIVTLLAFILINGTAFAIYMHAGVVRDVPELYVYMNNVHRNMHAEYVDRVYSYDKDFPTSDNGKINVLVIGNSFARDWGNILLESEMADKINLSYIFSISEKDSVRIKQADYVFIHDWKHKVPNYVWESVSPEAEVWGIGTKSFGESNGIIYKNRHQSDYFQQTIKINPNFVTMNELMKKEWKDKFVDLLANALVTKDSVVVFSKDHKFISQDTRHLTKGGAEFFAHKIDFGMIFNKQHSPKPSTYK